MSDSEVEIPVAVETEKPVEVVIDDKARTEAPKTTAIVTEDEGIKSLQAEAEKSRRESAERLREADRRIAEAHRIAVEAQQETAAVKKDHVGTIIENLTAQKEAARRDLIAAHEAGDFAKVADAQDRISLANARIVHSNTLDSLSAVIRPPAPQTDPFIIFL